MLRKQRKVSTSAVGNCTRIMSVVQTSTEAMKQRSYEDAVKSLNSLQTKAEVLARRKTVDTHSVGVKSGEDDAVKSLNSLQTKAEVLARIPRSKDRTAHDNLPKMRRFTERAGVKMEDLDKLSVIHISGTKGKGSTCAFCESILRHKGFKTGFYSSPHLMEVRERIRINGTPLHKDKFAKYFFDCWDNLHNSRDEHEKGNMPVYFRFLTLMCFHVFLQEKVDVAIVEVGVGGAYDSTNIIRKPVCCGVTSLGMDHVKKLGGTLETIAWHKAGIFKPGVPAFTVPQQESAMAVVAERAREVEAPLHVIPGLEKYPGEIPDLGLEGEHQYLNASLALQLCTAWLRRSQCKDDTSPGESPVTRESSKRELSSEEPPEKNVKPYVPVAETFEISVPLRNGLKCTRWCGRNQVIVRPKETFYLDGAHTQKSIEACAQWFKRRADKEKESESGSVVRVLLFNLTRGRDPHNLLRTIMTCDFDHAIFSPNTPSLDPKLNDADLTDFTVTQETQLQRCKENQRVWMTLRGTGFQAHAKPSNTCTGIDPFIKNGDDDGQHSVIFPSVSQSIRWLLAGRDPVIPPLSPGGQPLPDIISQAKRIQVLICGSLHLVGTAMKVLGPEIVGDV